jgi:hypothetical protein
MFRSFLFPLCFSLLVLVIESSANNYICDFKNCCKQAYPKDDIHYDYDNNLENGIIFPWIEQSESGVKWRVENTTSLWEPGNVAPTPVNGSTYLRVDRGSTLSFGVAVLRSQIFTLRTDEVATFSFDFWIRSKWPQFTNLEVIKTIILYYQKEGFLKNGILIDVQLYLAKNGNEGLRLNLYEYSHINNRVWESKEISLDGRDSTYNLNLSVNNKDA